MVLIPGKGANTWYRYDARVDEPRDGAIIIDVTNRADKRISLTHWDREDRRVGPVYLKAGETVDDFAGTTVAGRWQAEIGGGRDEAPNRVSLDIGYEVP